MSSDEDQQKKEEKVCNSGIKPTTFWSRIDGVTSTLRHLDRRDGLNRAIPASIIHMHVYNIIHMRQNGRPKVPWSANNTQTF